jgi:hypothetical protein
MAAHDQPSEPRGSRPLGALAVLAAAACASLALTAGPAAAKPGGGVRIVSPAKHSVVQERLSLAVRTASRRHVAFFVDGRRRAVRRPAPVSRKAAHRGRRSSGRRFARRLEISTRGLRDGRHRLVVAQRGRDGRLRRASRVVVVRHGRLTPPSRPQPTATAHGATWRATFENATLSEWSWVQRDDGGTFYAAPAAAEGVPALGGSGVGHFEVSQTQAQQGDIHSKLYKNWAVGGQELGWDDDEGRPLERLPNGSPAGTYSAWYFLPADYQASRSWANIFQFKESYVDGAGKWHQDPQWWLNVTPAQGWPQGERPAGVSGSDPVLAVSNWGGEVTEPRRLVPAPRGRWFEVRAVVDPGNAIDWYVDGQLLEHSSAATYPVGISKANATGWVFGIGHYGGIGKLWADDAAFEAR